jgi:hypothetical protein
MTYLEIEKFERNKNEILLKYGLIMHPGQDQLLAEKVIELWNAFSLCTDGENDLMIDIFGDCSIRNLEDLYREYTFKKNDPSTMLIANRFIKAYKSVHGQDCFLDFTAEDFNRDIKYVSEMETRKRVSRN